MPDFRKTLYRRYVTTFKAPEAPISPTALQSYWTWCRYKYLPLVKELNRDDPILELGCGPGYMMEFLRSQGFASVEGIDLSEEQVQAARDRGLTAHVADAFDFLAGRENAYDAIMTVDFIEHFTKGELLRLLPAIHRSLKPGGLLILQTPNGRGLFPNDVIYGDLTHVTIFTPESLAQLLRLTGFEDIRFQETGPVLKGLKSAIRVLLWRLIKACANFVRTIEAGKRQDIWTENFICWCRKQGKSQ